MQPQEVPSGSAWQGPEVRDQLVQLCTAVPGCSESFVNKFVGALEKIALLEQVTIDAPVATLIANCVQQMKPPIEELLKTVPERKVLEGFLMATWCAVIDREKEFQLRKRKHDELGAFLEELCAQDQGRVNQLLNGMVQMDRFGIQVTSQDIDTLLQTFREKRSTFERDIQQRGAFVVLEEVFVEFFVEKMKEIPPDEAESSEDDVPSNT
ncbi:MAG: hypothetical protein Q7R81_06485 [Candidatus Peregrinibacteria bacterium]|nr:hypothetical protein [Candidatus Peregrinibacteria bacterium]